MFNPFANIFLVITLKKVKQNEKGKKHCVIVLLDNECGWHMENQVINSLELKLSQIGENLNDVKFIKIPNIHEKFPDLDTS